MKTLGIIGGMGPMATAYLLELIIQMTAAKTDQEHLGAVVLNNPQVPGPHRLHPGPGEALSPAGADGHGPAPWRAWAAGCCARPASPLITFTRSWRAA